MAEIRRPDSPWRSEWIPRERCEDSGAQVFQLTSAPLIHSHIYPESPVFTRDSRFFIYACFSSGGNTREYWLCEVGSWRLYQMTDEAPVSGPVISPDGEHVYYVWERSAEELVLVRRNLWSLRREEIAVARDVSRPYVLGTMSPDGRCYATRVMRADGTAGILRYDVVGGEARVIHQHPEIFNAHPQWEPGRGGDILIQHNRGGSLDGRGQVIRLVGPQGGALYLIDPEGENVRPLAIGTPHTPRIQGHQCWLGSAGRVLATLGEDFEREGKKGNLVTVAEGDDAPTVMSGGRYFCHVSAAPDGRYWICDENPSGDVYVGSSETGRHALLARSGSVFGSPQYTHPHPFMSPDGRYAFFNSIRSGVPHIYACTIPEGLLESLAD